MIDILTALKYATPLGMNKVKLYFRELIQARGRNTISGVTLTPAITIGKSIIIRQVSVVVKLMIKVVARNI